jgi:hypothetical protein
MKVREWLRVYELSHFPMAHASGWVKVANRSARFTGYGAMVCRFAGHRLRRRSPCKRGCRQGLRASLVALNFGAFHPCFTREAIFTSDKTLNFGVVKLGSCFYVQLVQRALSGAIDIVHEITLLQHASLYSTGCSCCSINLRISRAKLVTFWIQCWIQRLLEML